MGLYQRWIHRKERYLTLQDVNRRVFPFDWGLEWLPEFAELNGTSPLDAFIRKADEYLRESDQFFQPAPLTGWKLAGEDRLSFPTPLPSRDDFNNQVEVRLFRAAADARRAVIVVPQWNADAESHVGLCRWLQRIGITVARLTLPYHENRRPPGMERADYMVSPNLGRTLQTTRQAVQEVRQLAQWLKGQGFSRIGVMGTSIGSCVSYLAFVHDTDIVTGVFNHVSAYFADVVWTGLSTRFVRWGLEGHIQLGDLRKCWAPVSPLCFVESLRHKPHRKHLMISARYDLTFIPRLSQRVFDEYREYGIPLESASLPCGHYTTAHFPFNYMDGWHICRFLYRHL